MRQSSLKNWVNSQPGWKTKESYLDKMKHYGIGFRAKYKNGWGLSFVAGEYVYSSPQKKSDNYSLVEVALLTKRGKVYGSHGNRKYFKYGVEGYQSLSEIKKLMKYVEGLR